MAIISLKRTLLGIFQASCVLHSSELSVPENPGMTYDIFVMPSEKKIAKTYWTLGKKSLHWCRLLRGILDGDGSILTDMPVTGACEIWLHLLVEIKQRYKVEDIGCEFGLLNWPLRDVPCVTCQPSDWPMQGSPLIGAHSMAFQPSIPICDDSWWWGILCLSFTVVGWLKSSLVACAGSRPASPFFVPALVLSGQSYKRWVPCWLGHIHHKNSSNEEATSLEHFSACSC